MENSRDMPYDQASDTGSFPGAEGGRRDANLTVDKQMSGPGKVPNASGDCKIPDFPTHFPVQQMRSPSDSQSGRQFHTMPAAGRTFPQEYDPNSSRDYKMASDIFGTGMDRSWSESPASVPGSPKIAPSQKSDVGNEGPRSVPRSFKITAMPASPSGSHDDQSDTSAAGRRARESNGNPLTGQGLNPGSIRTGKRYFEGSNSNQKLW